MAIKIGDKNKIKNSNIIDNVVIREKEEKEKKITERHPILVGAIVSFVIGIVLMFSFWSDIILKIEELF
ncbi:hypothetical protein [uncultured Clostridium sp.]|uniref:hypothetical protein n=1 Tax=uncultured Clostridium sp. TaxID=59620 RepID=UPI00258A6B62|nr:hypothetical protein [uncultured Clostridium sp.]